MQTNTITIKRGDLLEAAQQYAKRLLVAKKRFYVCVDNTRLLQVESEAEEETVLAELETVVKGMNKYDKALVFHLYNGKSQYTDSTQRYEVMDTELLQEENFTPKSRGGVGLDGLGANSAQEVIENRVRQERLEWRNEALEKENMALQARTKELEERLKAARKIAQDRKKRLEMPTPTTKQMMRAGIDGLFGLLSSPKMMQIAGLGQVSEQAADIYQTEFGEHYPMFVEIADYLSENRQILLQMYSELQAMRAQEAQEEGGY